MAEILTFDAGTSALKCSVFDENGELLGACTADYVTFYPNEGYAQQNVPEILSACVEAVSRLSQKLSLAKIDCIGLTGTMNGCALIDADGKPLYPNIIHLDTRAVTQVETLRSELGASGFYALTGNRPDVHYGLPKLMWLKQHEPDVYKRAWKAVNTKDVIYGFLTGLHGRSDYSDASLFGALNIHTRAWDTDVIAASGIDGGKLPDIYPSHYTGAGLSESAARLLGLRSGIPVAIGAGDGPATTHGSGVFDENGAYLTVGSSAWAAALSKTPCIDERMRAFNYTDMDERFVTVCGTVQCAATALDYALKTILGITGDDGGINFARAEKLCMSAPAGAHGLVYVPTLMGERCPWWDPLARGSLMGLTLTHTRADIVRAVYEGVAQELNLCVKVLRDNGIEADKLILSGGALKSSALRALFPSVFSARARVHLNPREATSLGAAICAGVGAGIWKDFAEAAKAVKTGAELHPDAADAAVYEKQSRVFAALYAQTADAMHALYDLQQEL